MAEYLPIRAFTRSQGVRIGGKRISRTVTSYVDISDPKVRTELQHHSAIGAIFPVGPISSSDSEWVVVEGGLVTAQGTPDQTVDVSAGELRNRSTGEYLSFAASDNEAASAADATLARIDIVQVDVTDGTISYKDGTEAATPAAPAPDADNIVLAQVARAANDNTIAAADITDVRPRP